VALDRQGCTARGKRSPVRHAQPMRGATRGVCAVVLAIIGALSCLRLYAAGESARELVSAGNRAFRAGHPDQAVALYQQAQKLGDSSPRVWFNLGVAQYRAGHYTQAIRALSVAARNAELAPQAWYNLGLTYWAGKDVRNAEACFEWAQRFAREDRLRQLAMRALQELRSGRESPRSYRDDEEEDQDQKSIQRPRAAPSIFMALRYGTDDNVYRTPDSPYIDLSRRTQPLITPTPQSGTFTEAKLRVASGARTRHHIRGTYDFDGQLHMESALKAADERSQRLALSSDTRFGKHGRLRFLTLTDVAQHKEINFDPDNGIERSSASGENLSDRFSYLSAGTRWNLEQAVGPATVGLRAKVEMRDYAETQSVAEYDHNFLLTGAYVEWPFGAATRVSAGYDRFRRDYDDRIARDLSGTLAAGNPLLIYDYDRFFTTARVKWGRRAYVRLTAERTERTDDFVGYNDYEQMGVRLAAEWSVSRAVRLSAQFAYFDYDFPNAFAFDVPAGGPQTLTYLDGELAVRINLWRNLSLWGAARTRDVSSPDTRADYSRRQFPIGLQWQQRF
jgi:hypothetical protein